MSNLKKVVSLALVLIMVVSMGASAAAAFTDANDIKFVDEVNLLTSLGILAGYPDGSFKPAGPVSRAEFAKMLFMIKLGHLDSSGFVNAASTFTDLEAAVWAKGYIKYLFSVGVVAGKSAASFDPNGQVTGYEAVKMLLVALGYKADQAGLVGEKWKINTLSLGADRGLLDGYNIDFDAPCTRELAALLISNALDAVCVKYGGLSLDANGNLTADVVDETHLDDGKTILSTLGWKAFGLYYETGYIVATDNLEKDGYSTTDKDWFTLESVGGTAIDKGDDEDIKFVGFDETLFGQEVVVAFKKATNGDFVAYGVTATGKSKVYTSALVDTKYDTDKLVLKVDGSTKEFKDAKIEAWEANVVYFDAAGSVAYASVDVDDLFSGAYDVTAGVDPVFGKNVRLPGTITAIDSDGNGKLDTYYVLGSAFGRVDTYNSSDKKFTLLGNATFKYEDDDFAKVSGDFKVGDYVFAGLKINGGINVVPAEKVNIKITKISDNKIFVDDKAYYGYAPNSIVEDSVAFAFANTYTVYTDGTFIAKKGVDSTDIINVDNVALVTYIGTDLKQVKLFKANGDEDIYSYTNKNDDDVIVNALALYTTEPVMVKFTVTDGKVKLSEISGDGSTDTGSTASKYDTSEKVVYDGVSYYLDASSRIFVVNAAGKVDVFSKSELKDAKDVDGGVMAWAASFTDSDAASIIYRTTSSGYKYAVAAYVKATKLPKAPTTDKFVFLTAGPSKWETTDGDYFSITGYCDGSKVDYTSDKDIAIAGAIKKFSWVKAELDSSSKVTAISVAGGIGAAAPFDVTLDDFMATAALAGYDSGYKTVKFFVNGANATEAVFTEVYTVNSDTKYFIMNADGSMSAATVSDLAIADYNPADTEYFPNVFFRHGSDDIVDVIIIMSTNRVSSISADLVW